MTFASLTDGLVSAVPSRGATAPRDFFIKKRLLAETIALASFNLKMAALRLP